MKREFEITSKPKNIEINHREWVGNSSILKEFDISKNITKPIEQKLLELKGKFFKALEGHHINYLSFYEPNELKAFKINIEVGEYAKNCSWNDKNYLQDPNLKQNDHGVYETVGIDLLKACTTYYPHGLLMWIPKLKCFANWDFEHQSAIFFNPDVEELFNDIFFYVNLQWTGVPGYSGRRPVNQEKTVKSSPKAGYLYDYYKPWEALDFKKPEDD